MPPPMTLQTSQVWFDVVTLAPRREIRGSLSLLHQKSIRCHIGQNSAKSFKEAFHRRDTVHVTCDRFNDNARNIIAMGFEDFFYAV